MRSRDSLLEQSGSHFQVKLQAIQRVTVAEELVAGEGR